MNTFSTCVHRHIQQSPKKNVYVSGDGLVTECDITNTLCSR